MEAMEAGDILVVLIGAALIVGGVFQIIKRFIFLSTSCTLRVPGTILDKERSERQQFTDSSKRVTYYLTYQYFVDGVEYSKRRSIGKRQLKVTGNPGEITIFYDPSKPKRHYVSELKFRMLLTLTLIAIGVILLYYSFGNVILL